MTDTQHTPGPWEIRRDTDVTGYPVFSIAGMSGEQKRDVVTLDANARLIAAAPDLLAALEDLRAEALAWLRKDPEAVSRLTQDVVDAAIAKARGN